MENSKIEWTDHTFNPWIGCTKISAGCANCYAETLMDKIWNKVEWGKGKERNLTYIRKILAKHFIVGLNTAATIRNC